MSIFKTQGVELGFNTSATLGVGATFSSPIIDITAFKQVQTNILADQDGTIILTFYNGAGGSDPVRSLTIPYLAANGYQLFSAPKFGSHVKYEYTNGSTIQGDFYYETWLFNEALSPQVLGVESFIAPAMTSSLTRSILVGKNAGGQYKNVSIEPVTNYLDIALPRTAFGEVEVCEPTPVVQVDFIYNVNTDVVDVTTTGSGTATQADAMAVLQTTAATSSSAEIATKRLLKYRPGQGAHVRGTALFTTGVANSSQLFGAGDLVDGLFFGYDGATFGIMSRVGSVDTWVAQTAWNGDVMDGSGSLSNPSGQLLDPTKGNVFQIDFQWLGFGRITYGIEDAVSGRFVPVHTIEYANNYITPSLLNPSFPILWRVENTTNATNITLKGASCCGEIEGKIKFLGPTNAIGFSKTGVTTTLTSILTIQNKSTFASKTNRTPINILKYSVSVDGTKPAEFQLIKNATLGGTPSYTDISTNTSVMSYDTAGTTVTGGEVIDFATLSKDGSINESPANIEDIYLNPTDTLTLAVAASASTTDVSAAVRWVEDF